jgi:hypothetical protein
MRHDHCAVPDHQLAVEVLVELLCVLARHARGRNLLVRRGKHLVGVPIGEALTR